MWWYFGIRLPRHVKHSQKGATAANDGHRWSGVVVEARLRGWQAMVELMLAVGSLAYCYGAIAAGEVWATNRRRRVLLDEDLEVDLDGVWPRGTGRP